MTFNVAFFADTHIDYSYASRADSKGVNLRVRDGYNALEAIIRDIEVHKDEIDAIVMGGDLFHTSHPTVRSIAIVQHWLRELYRLGLPIDILAGNHDATDDREYPAAVAVVDDRERNIRAHYTPYTVQPLADGVSLHVLSHHGLHPDAAPKIKPVEGDLNIFTTHGAAMDPGNDALMRCMDSPREQIVTSDIILNEDFNLRLLGHYHSRSFVGDPSLNTWYAGSTVRRGFSDSPGARGWTLFKIHENGHVEVEHHDIFQRPQVDFEVIDASNMTARSLEEKILFNLDSTRGDVGEGQFDEVHAPILRQRIINAPHSIRDGLDFPLLKKRADHSLKWLLEITKPNASTRGDIGFDPDADAALDDHEHLKLSRTGGSLDVVKSYSSWADTNSAVLQGLNKEYREPVKGGAENHLKTAQDNELSK